MDKEKLKDIAQRLVTDNKGILAADESFGTIKKRFDTIGVESNEETRRRYRELLFVTPGVEEFISGVILFDETTRQSTGDGRKFSEVLKEKGILPGIKVDKGKVDMPNFPGEKITEGLDGLRESLGEYKGLGAEFAKWRSVTPIGESLPVDIAIETNARKQALYASFCQEQDIVPIVEPEVLINGDHTMSKAKEITYKTLKIFFEKLSEHKIYMPGMLLKTSMVVPGKESGQEMIASEVSRSTIECFSDVVPDDIGGIVFLSGGQSPQDATINLNEINKIGGVWPLSFSYGRALQEPVLKTWQGNDDNWEKAQKAFYKRARLNSLARQGKYKESMEAEV